MASNLSAPLEIIGQDLLLDSSTQLMPLGTYAETNDGRGFRYCKVGAVSLVPGKLYQSPAQDTTNLNPSGGLSVAASAIGATTITTTSTVTLTANQLAGGWVSVAVTPGQGYTYKIKSHPAATAAVVTLTLEDPIVVALTTASKITLTPNPYNGVIVFPATQTGSPAGVAVGIITNGNFGWLQTHGAVSTLVDTAIAVGSGIVPSQAVAGAVKLSTAGTGNAAIGYAMQAGVNTEYDLMYLMID